MPTAIDVVRKIIVRNAIPFLNFNVYTPHGWKAGTLKHFKQEKSSGQRRDPVGAIEHTPPNSLFTLSHSTVAGEQFIEILNNRPNGSAIEVVSKIFRDTKIAHIPMLDIELTPSPENLSYLVSCLQALGESEGAILLSGASYHYYGYNLLTNYAWLRFMYRSLLLDGIVDTRWVGHRLIDDHANLRITPKGEYNFIPYVVMEL